MRVDLVRRIDFWFGVPLCFAFTQCLRIAKLMRGSRPASTPLHPRRILFLKLAEMGSVVLIYPALERARQKWPDAELHFLTFDDSREIVTLLGCVPDQHLLTISTRGPLEFARSLVAVMRRVRKLGIDVAIDLEMFARCTALLSVLSGARSRVGFDRFRSEGLYRGDLLTHRVLYNPYLHTARGFLTLIEALDHDPDAVPLVKADVSGLPLPLPKFAPPAGMRESVVAMVESIRATWRDGNQLLLLNPNASELIPIRKWPLERYVELVRRLLANPKLVVAIIGQRVDAARAAEIRARIDSDRLIDLTERTDLKQLLTLFTVADALITNDSGPAHFATLTDLPTVTLFGPETPQLYAPLGVRQRSLYAGLACSPCVSVTNHRDTPCRYAQCLHDIAVEHVLGALTELRVLA